MGWFSVTSAGVTNAWRITRALPPSTTRMGVVAHARGALLMLHQGGVRICGTQLV
jgi:hypothetical protein